MFYCVPMFVMFDTIHLLVFYFVIDPTNKYINILYKIAKNKIQKNGTTRRVRKTRTKR